MKIDNKKTEKLFKLDKELGALREEVSNGLKIVKDGSNKAEIEFEEDGKQRKISEKDAWTEVFHLGRDSGAYIALKKKYPKLLTLSEEETKKAEEYNQFVLEEFGIEYSKMTFSQLMKLITGIVEHLLEKKS